MSLSYFFKIKMAPRGTVDLSAVDIIQCFLENGWILYSENNEIIYTDVGDNDDFDYLAKPTGKDKYFEIVCEKEKRKENIAVALFYLEENHRYRIDLILAPDYSILISPSDSTKKMFIANPDILDVNWYLNKVIPILNKNNMVVEGVTFTQWCC